MEREKKTERIALRVTKSDLVELREIADELGLDSVSSVIYMALKQFKKNQQINKQFKERLTNDMLQNVSNADYVSQLVKNLKTESDNDADLDQLTIDDF